MSSWLTLAHAALLEFSRRAEADQSTLFTDQQNTLQRQLAIAGSVLSITLCLVAIYFFLAIDPKRLVFRHQLIAFLIIFDLLKAVVLLIFPATVLLIGSSYSNRNFCQVVGFFTATSIEGADIAILAFAVHTFLLIFRPSLTVKFRGSDRVEGGLYRWRYYVYGLSFIIPLVLASLPYAGIGYSSYVCWCYLPQAPYWYRLVLSWTPRFVIVIIIFAVYGLIYIHVLREFRTLGGAFTTMHRLKLKNGHSLAPKELTLKPSFFNALRFFLEDMRDCVLPKLVLPEETKTPNDSSSSDSNLNGVGSNYKADESTDDPIGPADVEASFGDAQLQEVNLRNFRRRQKVIEKQMKSIFVYPIAYISIWLFPFILYCTQFKFERTHGPVVWLNCVSAFMQPFYGFVDACVFFYREQPAKYTIMRNFERDNTGRLDQFISKGAPLDDAESIYTSRVTKSSFAASLQVDISRYSRWRQLFSKLHLPFFELPSEENILKFQTEHISRRMEAAKQMGVSARSQQLNTTSEIHGLQAKHDFSNLLNGAVVENDFRQTFDGYSLSFHGSTRKSSVSSAAVSGNGRRPSVASLSNKSTKSRRMSTFEGHDPIPEDHAYNQGPNWLSRPSGNANPQRKSVQSNRTSSTDGGELDLLDFLRNGPV